MTRTKSVAKASIDAAVESGAVADDEGVTIQSGTSPDAAEPQEGTVQSADNASTDSAVQPEKPFGEDPDDLAGDVAPEDTTGDPVDEDGARATYTGLKGEDRFHPVAITLIVPPDFKEVEYSGLVTTGRTYTLPRGKSVRVAGEHAKWLRNHPAYDIEVEVD